MRWLPMPLITIVIPVYNERSTLIQLLDAVAAVDLGNVEREVIVVDDGSSDGTRELMAQEVEGRPDTKVFYHERNQGKGAALRTGFAACSGDVVLIQDADLEYDPQEFPRLVKPILDGRADVVYGSRFVGGDLHRVLYFWHSVGNRALTTLSNMLTDINLTDMETCYKVFRGDVIRSIQIEENRFGFEPEITAKLARGGYRFYEVGISYNGRTYEQGKKITWKDGMRALWCILKYNRPGR